MYRYTISALQSAAGIAICLGATQLLAQATSAPTNDAPNPYTTVEGWAQLPPGRTWGSTSAVEIDKDGISIWVAERCAANNCGTSDLDPIFKFDSTGRMVLSFGAGLLVSPHGIHVDSEGNVWVTDCACTGGGGRGRGAGRGGDSSAAGRGGQPPAPTPPPKGHQIFKFSPTGQLLMTLGKVGGAQAPDYFFQPNDVLVTPSGEIFVAEGHGQGTDRVLKFSKDGTFIKEWGKRGTGVGEFNQPHALAMDSRGRLYVGDRSNDRIQIFDQEGTFIAEWKQFSRPSGIFIDAADNIYVADSESGSVAPARPEWKRGIRIGRISDGSVTAFIPDPNEAATNTSAAEGVAVDRNGVIYGAEVGPRALKRYIRR